MLVFPIDNDNIDILLDAVDLLRKYAPDQRIRSRLDLLERRMLSRAPLDDADLRMLELGLSDLAEANPLDWPLSRQLTRVRDVLAAIDNQSPPL